MMRLSRLVMLSMMVLLCTRAATAQTSATAPADPPFYGEFGFGPTFGHHSSGFYGGEIGYRFWEGLSAAFEVGHMGNVGSQNLDDRASMIADSIGATYSASYQVTYFDFGLRYAFNMPRHAIKPYVAFGVGAAKVNAETVLSVNGTPVTPDSVGVTFGNDLNGSETKSFFTIGGGATANFKERFFGDLSFRYAHIGTSSDIDGDVGVNTSRLQFAVGVRF